MFKFQVDKLPTEIKWYNICGV